MLLEKSQKNRIFVKKEEIVMKSFSKTNTLSREIGKGSSG
jgi:uncharacterized protein (DUF427 family)